MTMPTIAVIGAGISGLTAAYVLRDQAHVTLFEADDRLGGHAHTHHVQCSQGLPLAVDSGFIVHNDRTYPLLRRLFAELGTPAQPTEMSMSIAVPEEGLEYAGGKGYRGWFAQTRRARDPRFLAMLAQVPAFQRAARAHLLYGAPEMPLGEFLANHGFSEDFVRWYAVPVIACVWSTEPARALEYPARHLFAFLQHHGMLSLLGSPQWYTIPGGSARYVHEVARRLEHAGAVIHRGTPITSVARDQSGVELTDSQGASHRVDRVIIATHADAALSMLADPTDAEREVLGAFEYTRNRAVLHHDASLLPAAMGARASWNYLAPEPQCEASPPVVTYWMNLLQHLTDDQPWLVTLGAEERIDPATVVTTADYTHPLFTLDAVRAQHRLPELASATTAYAGAHHGWGFHEDGCRSGVAAARWAGWSGWDAS